MVIGFLSLKLEYTSILEDGKIASIEASKLGKVKETRKTDKVLNSNWGHQWSHDIQGGLETD